MNILLTVEELAKYLKIKPDTIYKKVRRGELPAIKLGKLVRFPKDLIDQWIVEQATKTKKAVDGVKKEVRKTAKIAGKVMEKAPEMIDQVKRAPLNQKQAILTKNLKTLWKDFNTEVKKTTARAARPKAHKKAGAKATKKKVAPIKVTAAPETNSKTTTENNQVS